MSILYKRTLLNYHFNTIKQLSSLLKSKHLFPKYFTYYKYYSAVFPEKKYPKKENAFARSVLENISAYNMMIFNPTKDYTVPEKTQSIEKYFNNSHPSDLPIQELCSLLESIVHLNSENSDYIYVIFDVIKMRCHEMNDDQLASVLKNLNYSSIFECEKSDKLLKLWKEIDRICSDRLASWSLITIFYFMDLFYTLGLTRKSEFVFSATLKCLRKPKRLSPQQVVQLLFYFNILRYTTKNVSMFDLECRLEECIKEFTINEIGIAVMGFFKTENVIHNEKLVNYIIDKTIDEIKTIPEITLACILKALRNSVKVSVWHKIPELLDAIEPELPRFSIQCSVHVSLLTTKGQILHEGVLKKISQKLVDNITACRLKDMEKVMFPLSQLNFNPETDPCIYETIVNELNKDERQFEIKKYPKTFIALVHYLCLKGLCVENLIKQVLDMEYIHSTYGKNKFLFGREILYIDTTVELEYPSYVGPRLPVDIRNYLSKRYSEYLPDSKKRMSKHQQLHAVMKGIVETTFGKENVTEKYLLPNHPRADMVVNLDSEKIALPLDNNFKNIADFTGPIKAPVEVNYHAIVVGSKNMFLYQSTKLNGETASKLKQLRLLGYTPILLRYEEWPKDMFQKIKHLKTLMAGT